MLRQVSFGPLMDRIRGAQGVIFLDFRRKDKIRTEMKKAEEYLNAAEVLQKSCLFTPSATASYYAAYHAAIAAFLSTGFHNPQRDQFVSFVSAIHKFNHKLDPFVEKLKKSKDEWALNTALDYTENESLLRFHQTREFVLEVRDFLRRALKI